MGPSYGSAGRRPYYWSACQKMDFGELQEFIDDSLGKPPMFGKGPRTRDDYLGLLEMLSGKGGFQWTRWDGECTWGTKICRKYRGLLAQQEQAQRALGDARRTMPADMRARGETTKRARKAQRGLTVVREQIAHMERKHGSGGASGRRVVARIFADIERAFSADARGSGPSQEAAEDAPALAKRLPWSLLPPGELSLEKVLAHYGGLGRAYPDVRYEPERIRKAYSLGPDGIYVGSGEFDGYVVFTFPSTDKALLERPVYGNAIYVLGSDWKRLSRLSKRELLSDRALGVERIPHVGDWFARTKRALGLR